jgi:hypothetical protein
MSGEIEDGAETGSRGVLSVWLCWAAGIVVLYILSTGPVIMMFEKRVLRPGGHGERAVQIVYWPVDRANQQPLLSKPLGMYWHLWAPKLYDAQGNRKVGK